MRAKAAGTEEVSYLDLQAAFGITKHSGGYAATDELLELCHADRARAVLNAGCGIGVGSIYLARKYGSHVWGIDRSPQMIDWARRRARAAHVEHAVEWGVADMLGLPFAANSFDLAYCESVLCFIEDKTQAIAELVRVTRPGGYVGISEAFWTSMPSAALAVQMQTILGTRQPLPTRPEWQALWAGSGLAEQDARFHPVESRREVADRIAWVGRSWLLRAIGRGLQLYLTDPVLRRTVQTQIRFPIQGLDQLSYGIFVGRKAA